MPRTQPLGYKTFLAITCSTIMACLFFGSCLPCQAQQAPWVCPDDNPTNGVYRTCNYWPLSSGNQWQYTTGEYHVANDTHTCSSGYSGILFATATYEFSSYLQNGKDGLLFAGCQYDEGILEDLGQKIVLIPPELKIGETVRSSVLNSIFDATLVGLETITVPAGTFDTLKIELVIQDIGECSYKTTWWLAKGIGPVKVHRTDANPADCGGCVFVCVENDDHNTKLNIPAELTSYFVAHNTPLLTLTKSGSASGTVTSSPSGISCGSTCTASYDSGATVTLTPTPGAGSYFAGWSTPCSGNSVCTLTLTTNTQITAAFGLTAPAYYDTVQKVYIGYYQRPADPGGLLYWAERLAATNGNLNEIIEAYASSEESQVLYGTINSSTIEAVINGIYNALFNRDAEPGGLAYYRDGFNAGRFTAATIMLNVLYGAQNEDLQSINNKLAAANLFTRTIDPELDGYNFQVTYAGQGDVIAARNFLAPVTENPTTVPSQDTMTAWMKDNIADPGDQISNMYTIDWQAYFNYQVGRRWQYSTPSSEGTYSEYIKETTTKNGFNVYVKGWSSNYSEWLDYESFQADGVYFVGYYDEDARTDFFFSTPCRLFPNVVQLDTPTTITCQGTPSASVEVTFELVDEVTVPYGTFNNVMKVTHTSDGETRTDWYASGFGQIRDYKASNNHDHPLLNITDGNTSRPAN